jgi:chromate transporter
MPGFVLMLLLSWFYVQVGLASPIFAAIFYGFQPAVAGLIVRATLRIGRHALTDRWLWGIMLMTAAAELLGVPFLITLACAGLAYALVRSGFVLPATLLIAGLLIGAALLMPARQAASQPVQLSQPRPTAGSRSLGMLFSSGVRSGLLTFGGAYTVIPYLQHDAVDNGGWMTNQQFLDGLALSGMLPAPLIIFATFVGYLGGGLSGAIMLTIGIFLPAFAITLAGHSYLERLVEQPLVGTFLAGVTAGVVGLIAIVGGNLVRTAVTDYATLAIFALALLLLYRWRANAAVVGVLLGAGVLGLLLVPG